jgi:hypothetical protein
LSANTEIEVNPLATLSISIVPTIVSPPIRSGSAAATRPRKKISESTKRIGNAYSSAVRRSSSTCSFA